MAEIPCVYISGL